MVISDRKWLPTLQWGQNAGGFEVIRVVGGESVTALALVVTICTHKSKHCPGRTAHCLRDVTTAGSLPYDECIMVWQTVQVLLRGSCRRIYRRAEKRLWSTDKPPCSHVTPLDDCH